MVRCALDGDWLSSLSQRLRSSNESSPLFDTEQWVRNLEAVLAMAALGVAGAAFLIFLCWMAETASCGAGICGVVVVLDTTICCTGYNYLGGRIQFLWREDRIQNFGGIFELAADRSRHQNLAVSEASPH